MRFLQQAARHGRLVLIIGLFVGVAFPALGMMLKPGLGVLVGLVVFLSALRIGPEKMLGKIKDVRSMLGLVLIYQVLMPCLFIAALTLFGLSGVIATALILMLAGPPISGSPNITLMTGHDPAPSQRYLVIAMICLPVTVIPVFYFAQSFGGMTEIVVTAFRLLLVIVGATVLASLVRHTVLKTPNDAQLKAIDGLSAIIMAVVVVGLMVGVQPALANDPLSLVIILLIACAVNFGLQIATWFALGLTAIDNARAAFSVANGNRNMALFLAALPTTITDELLIFIGCYQIPMYLTPVAMQWLYGKRKKAELE